MGFYISKYQPNLSVSDFDNLVKTGCITVVETSPGINTKPNIPLGKIDTYKLLDVSKKRGHSPNIIYDKSNIVFKNFYSIDSLKIEDLQVNGFYCIRLKKGKELPNRYHKHLRPSRLIYIGKAEGQTLKKRLYNQELNAIGHGTFFRSMGAVLGFVPGKGSLVNKKNKRNYTFSSRDTKEIIKWMRENLEVSWVEFNGDFAIERALINEYRPLLNLDYNLDKLKELQEDRRRCVEIATSL